MFLSNEVTDRKPSTEIENYSNRMEYNCSLLNILNTSNKALTMAHNDAVCDFWVLECNNK